MVNVITWQIPHSGAWSDRVLHWLSHSSSKVASGVSCGPVWLQYLFSVRVDSSLSSLAENKGDHQNLFCRAMQLRANPLTLSSIAEEKRLYHLNIKHSETLWIFYLASHPMRSIIKFKTQYKFTYLFFVYLFLCYYHCNCLDIIHYLVNDIVMTLNVYSNICTSCQSY